MMPKEPMRGATLFSHANKMTQAYHVMLTPLCKEAGLPPLALDILLFLANNPEHNTAKDGWQVQWQLGRRLLEGIPEEDLATMRRCLERMDGNLNGICKEKR